jgi:cytochrome c-type biogenesis protein CcmH/NrfG
MAEINATREQERAQERVKAAVTAYRAMLDTFVNNPERRIASEAEQARPRQSQGAQAQSTKAL